MSLTKKEKIARVPRFFPPVLSALRLTGADKNGLHELSDAEWHDLLAFCDLAHLTLPLVMTCQSEVPPSVLARAQENIADNKLRVRKIESAYLEIAGAFESAGIEHLVIKGFAQSPEFVDPAEHRMQSDIDLYCPKEFIFAAQAVLTGLGYVGNPTLDKYPADHLPEMTRRQGWQWRGNLYDPEMPPSVDLHFCFWNEATSRLSIPGAAHFWERRILRQKGYFNFPALSTIDNLAFNALHILRDLQRGDWVLHHVYELAWFLHHHAEDEELWDAWTRSHDDSLRALQAISFWLAREWFGCRWNSVIDREAAGIPHPAQQWLKRFSQSPLTGMFSPNKHGVWLHIALLESRRDKLLILGKVLMPLRLPAVGAPGQASTKTRQTRKVWPSQPYPRYLLHLIFRVAFHLRTLPDTLWHGICWLAE